MGSSGSPKLSKESDIVVASPGFGRRRHVALQILFTGMVKTSVEAPPFRLEDVEVVELSTRKREGDEVKGVRGVRNLSILKGGREGLTD